jgi:hypothetical protein
MSPYPLLALEDRFWGKVDHSGDGCWVWRAGRNRRGYGTFRLKSGSALAHRVAFELEHGPIPPGMHVCHHCDNPPCVNPAHLFLGTDADNVADMMAKGRKRTVVPTGESHPSAKLTWAKVAEIRRLYAAGGHSQRDLGRQFGVGLCAIQGVVTRKTWIVAPPVPAEETLPNTQVQP